MATGLFATSVSDINVSFDTTQNDGAAVIQDLKTKLEKQSHSFVKLKQKIIATDSVLKSYKQTKEQLEDKEKQLQSQLQEYENISANYKSLLEKFIPLEKLYDEQKESFCSLQAELQNVKGQKLATDMHIKQLQELVNNQQTMIDVAKVEYQLLKSGHEEEKKKLIKESKSPRIQTSNKIQSDLLMFGKAARKAGVLTKRQILLLDKYIKSEETTCRDVEDDVSDITDIQKSPAYTSNHGILSCRSVDTGRGSSLMSSDDEKISDNILCELIDDSQINTPLCSPKTVDTILDAGLLEAKLKFFCTTATSPIQRSHVDACTSPIKKTEKHSVERPSTPNIIHKPFTKHQVRNEVSDTRVNKMLKEMITDYSLVSPIPWKDNKNVKRRVPTRGKVEQRGSKLRYMLDGKKSRLWMHKAINNMDRKVNKLLERKNEVPPPNVPCSCNSKMNEPKPMEKFTSDELISLVSRVALQTSNQMNNSIISTILNTLLPLNSIYSSLKVAETDKNQEILKTCMDYITTRGRTEAPEASLNSFQKTSSNVSSANTVFDNETIQKNLSLDPPINDIANVKPTNTVERNNNSNNKSKPCSKNTLNKNNDEMENLPLIKDYSENHKMIVHKPIESIYTRPSNDGQTNYPPNLRESSTNCEIDSSEKLAESTGIKRKKKETINETLISDKKCSKATANTTPVEPIYHNLFGDSISDCHEETSDEDRSVLHENITIKTNSPIKKVTRNSKITKLQSLRKSLRCYKRKIQREPSPPPKKKKNAVQATESKKEISQSLEISEVTTGVPENFKKAVRIMNEINKKKLEESPVQHCRLRKSRVRKKIEDEQLTNEVESDKSDSVIENVNVSDHASLEIQTESSKLHIWSSINCDTSSNGGSSRSIISPKISITNEENTDGATSTESHQDTQTSVISNKEVYMPKFPMLHVINYDDLEMFTETKNNASPVHSPVIASETPENSKSFFIRMIEKYSSLRKKKTKHSVTGKVPPNITNAIHTCISNILDSTLNEPVQEMNKLCDQMFCVKPTDFARAVVETLMGKKQPNDCFCHTYTPPAPPMYKSEQILLYVINKIQKININYAMIIATILDIIEYKLFRLGCTPEMEQVECLSRFFAVVCRQTKQMRKLRTFVLDAIYCLNFKVLCVFREVINVWSHIIPTARTKTAHDPLVLTIVHLIHFLNCNNEVETRNIRKILATRYGYSPGDCTEQELLKKLDALIKGIGINDKYHHKSLSLAFILIGKRYGPQWCHIHLINGIITPILNDTVLDQHVRSYAASLLGPLLRPYPAAMSLHCEMAINKLTLLIENGESPEMEEAAISSVLMLKKFVYSRVVKTLQNWEPRRPISVELENQIKEFIREKQTGAWIKILEKA